MITRLKERKRRGRERKRRRE